MHSEISDKEIDDLLKAAGLESPERQLSNQSPVETNTSIEGDSALKIKEESLEKLLDEIMGGSTRAGETRETFSGSLAAQERQLASALDKEKKQRWLPAMTLWLAISILVAFFLGTAFGLYWGHTPRVEPTLHSFEKIEEQLSLLRSELLTRNASSPQVTQPQGECIEILESPLELDPIIPQPLR